MQSIKTVLIFTVCAASAGISYEILKSWLDVPYGFWDPWSTHDRSLLEGIASAWPVYVWAVLLSLLVGFANRGRQISALERKKLIIVGGFMSIYAGVFEELFYRWVLLFWLMMALKLLNIVTFGLVEWVYVHAFIPFANFVTFGLLEAQLYGDKGWLFAAAILLSSVLFAQSHEGINRLNTLALSVFFFAVMFNYGLIAAMGVHLLYNLIVVWMLVFFTRYQPGLHSPSD